MSPAEFNPMSLTEEEMNQVRLASLVVSEDFQGLKWLIDGMREAVRQEKRAASNVWELSVAEGKARCLDTLVESLESAPNLAEHFLQEKKEK